MAVQHASLAASVLLFIVHSLDEGKVRDDACEGLHFLDGALAELSPTYEQADRLSKALKGHLGSAQLSLHKDGRDRLLAVTQPSPIVAATSEQGSLGPQSGADNRQPPPQIVTPLSLDGAVDDSRQSIQISPGHALDDALMERSMAEKLRNASVCSMDPSISVQQATPIFEDTMDAFGNQEIIGEDAAETWARTLGASRAVVPQEHDSTIDGIFGNVFQFNKLVTQE